MPPTDRELWLLNFYRNSELHGALLMGRLAGSLSGTELLTNVTRHCATEARHAALLTEVIAELGGEIDPKIGTIQEHYSRDGGVQKLWSIFSFCRRHWKTACYPPIVSTCNRRP